MTGQAIDGMVQHAGHSKEKTLPCSWYRKQAEIPQLVVHFQGREPIIAKGRHHRFLLRGAWQPARNQDNAVFNWLQTHKARNLGRVESQTSGIVHQELYLLKSRKGRQNIQPKA